MSAPTSDERMLLVQQELVGAHPLPREQVLPARCFPDGEVLAGIGAAKVAGRDVLVVWSTRTATWEPNAGLMGLCQVLEAARRNGARSCAVYAPFLGYQRQDRPTGPGEPVSGHLVLRLLRAAGAESVSTIDPHSLRVARDGDLPLSGVSADASFAEALSGAGCDVVVSPDAGGADRAAALAGLLGLLCVVARKHRRQGRTSFEGLDTRPLAGRHVLIRDDLASTGSTLEPLVALVRSAGASRVTLAVSHVICDVDALEHRLDATVVHTNSCGQRSAQVDVLDVLRQTHAAPLPQPATGGRAPVTA